MLGMVNVYSLSMTATCPICDTSFSLGSGDVHCCPRCDVPHATGCAAEYVDAEGCALPAVPGYILTEVLGTGGMGVVYRAFHEETQRVVALKMVCGGIKLGVRGKGDRFMREIQAASRMEHPHVVPIYETGRANGFPYFTMKLVDGGNLATRRTDFTLPQRRDIEREQQLARWWTKVVVAVQHVHEQGVLHRDLKPSNILIDQEGEPHLADFGLAGLLDDESHLLTISGDMLGTPLYLAPELASGGTKASTVQSDIYSLGVMLYELLCGKPPFTGNTPLAVMHAAATRDPVHPQILNPGLSDDLCNIAMCCISYDPRQRYTTVAALADDLRRFVANEKVAARSASWVDRVLKDWLVGGCCG